MLIIGRMLIMSVATNVSLKMELIFAKKLLDEKTFRDRSSRFVNFY